MGLLAASAAWANPTVYDLNIFLGQRDPFAEQFWNAAALPAAPVSPPRAFNDLYDFRIFLERQDPFAQRFWAATPPVYGAGPGAGAARN